MNKVAVMTNSLASVPLEMQREYGIGVIPFHFIIDDKDYLDTDVKDMTQFYARLREREILPTTSFPTPEEFLQFYQALSQNAAAILHISLTAVFSGEYEAALKAKEMARGKLPNTTIEVIDSKTVEGSLPLITIEAAKATAQGKDLNEVTQLVNDIIPRVNQLSIRDTLFYLDKGGRIFDAKSWAETEAEVSSSFRGITEVDASTGGRTKPVARAKTKAQIMDKMVDIARERMGDKKLRFVIAHANVPDQAEQLKQKMLSSFRCDEFYVVEISPIVAIHNGEGIIGLGFYSSE
jgi:DegV family protein with EDD domain